MPCLFYHKKNVHRGGGHNTESVKQAIERKLIVTMRENKLQFERYA